MTTDTTTIEVTESIVLSDGDAARIWQAVGGFAAIADWHPAIEAAAIESSSGAPVRTLALAGGGEIVERQESRDDSAMRYTYEILESPLPIANYRSTLSAAAAPGGTRIVWTGSFEAAGASDAEAAEIVQGVYAAGLQGMAEFTGASVA